MAADRRGRREQVHALRILSRWHRRIGLASFIVLVFVAVTGMLLAHARELGLHEVEVEARYLLGRHGSRTDAPVTAFPIGQSWAAWMAEHLVVDGRVVGSGMARPVGVGLAGPLAVIAAPLEIVVVSPEGDIVERLGQAALPAVVNRLGAAPGGDLVIDTDGGIFRADPGLLGWERFDGPVVWSQPAEPPADVVAEVRMAVQAARMSLERVLLEMHTGRLLGRAGVFLIDAAAVCLLLLAASGLLTAIKPSTRRRSVGR